MEINDRLKEFVSHIGLSERQFAFKCGLSEGALRPGKNLNGTGLAKVKKTYPELNLYWVLLGEGEMVMNSDAVIRESGVKKIDVTVDQIITEKINQLIDERVGNVKELIRELILSEMESEIESVKKELAKGKNESAT